MKYATSYLLACLLLCAMFFSLNCSDTVTPETGRKTDDGDAGPICFGTVIGYDPLAGTYYPLYGALVVVRTYPGGSESYGYDYTDENGEYEVYNLPPAPLFNYAGTLCLVDCRKVGYIGQTIGPILLPDSNPVDWVLVKQ